MINKFNERITITLNKRLVKDLKKTAKKSFRPFSKFIQDLLYQGLETYKMTHIKRTPEEEKELEEMYRIIHYNWLDDNNE